MYIETSSHLEVEHAGLAAMQARLVVAAHIPLALDLYSMACMLACLGLSKREVCVLVAVRLGT